MRQMRKAISALACHHRGVELGPSSGEHQSTGDPAGWYFFHVYVMKNPKISENYQNEWQLLVICTLMDWKARFFEEIPIPNSIRQYLELFSLDISLELKYGCFKDIPNFVGFLLTCPYSILMALFSLYLMIFPFLLVKSHYLYIIIMYILCNYIIYIHSRYISHIFSQNFIQFSKRVENVTCPRRHRVTFFKEFDFGGIAALAQPFGNR